MAEKAQKTKTRNTQKAREAADVTTQVADEVIEEIIDYNGRRPVMFPGNKVLYIRMPDSGEDNYAEQIYSIKLYEYKQRKIPFVATVARSILEEVSNPDTFGRRERRIINQEEIEKQVEEYAEAIRQWEKDKETDPNAPEPPEPEYPEPIVEEGSESLKDILDDIAIGPFQKTQALMTCLAATEYANLVTHTAEYLAGRARTRFVISQVVETGDVQDGVLVNIKPMWKRDGDELLEDAITRMDRDSPDMVGYLEGAYIAFQQEVLSKDFLLRL